MIKKRLPAFWFYRLLADMHLRAENDGDVIDKKLHNRALRRIL